MSIWNVSGVTSTNTGISPARSIGAMSVENVTAEVMISSPGSSPSTSMARYNAELPELHITPRRLAKSRATSASIAFTFLPMRNAVGPRAEHLDDRFDLAFVVDRPGVLDPTRRGDAAHSIVPPSQCLEVSPTVAQLFTSYRVGGCRRSGGCRVSAA